MAEGNWRTSVEQARRVAERLLDEDQRITMNLFSLILSDEASAAWTDERQFLICQSNPRTSAWAWFAPDADAAADVTVTCRQGDLASLLMGSCQLEGMLRLGAASADNGEAAQQLSRLLNYGQKPWLNSDY